MKSIVVFLVFLSGSAYAQHTSIRLSVADGAGKPIAVTPPVDGNHLRAAQRLDTLDGQGQLVVDEQLNAPGLFVFDYQRRNYYLYVHPGEKYTIRIDAKDAEKPLHVISGAFHEGQEALGRLSFGYGRATLEAENYSKQDTVFENIYQNVLATVSQRLAVFERLFAKGEIDLGFYETAKLLLQNHYAHVLTETLLNIGLYEMVYRPDSAGYDRKVINDFGRYWKDVFKLADLGNLISAKVPTYFDYHDRIIHWYYGAFLPKSEGRFPPPGRRNLDDYWQELYGLTKEYHPAGALQEYLLASQIHSISTNKRYQAFLIDLFTGFIESYPNSTYSSYLEPYIDEVYAFHAKKQQEEPSRYQFVQDHGMISSFDELIQHFPDQLVYIDLWATWCVPCKQEFGFSAALKEFADTHHVTLLYVSIDKDEYEDRWKKMIAYYDLKGHHIRASGSLLADLRRRFSPGAALTIPRYILVKKGEVVLDDAMRPSAGETLYQQIRDVLKTP